MGKHTEPALDMEGVQPRPVPLAGIGIGPWAVVYAERVHACDDRSEQNHRPRSYRSEEDMIHMVVDSSMGTGHTLEVVGVVLQLAVVDSHQRAGPL